MTRRRAETWRGVAAELKHADPRNELGWQHARGGRPAPDWEEPLVRCVGADWASRFVLDTAPPTQELVAKLLVAYGQSAAAARVTGAAAMAERPGRKRPIWAASAAESAFAECGGAGWHVEACMDAAAAVEALTGRTRPPSGDAAAEAWGSTCELISSAWLEGARWRARLPVRWVPRELNRAADALATMALRTQTGRWWAELAELVEIRRADVAADRPSAVRIFSDGGRRGTAAAAGAFVALLDRRGRGRGWRIAALAAVRMDGATVPVAELRGGQLGWSLEAALRRALLCRAPWPPDGAALPSPVGRALAAQVSGLELLATLAWRVGPGQRSSLRL